jgi:16S rRNA (cytidine1402-2'-O)-methyltransferase
VRALPATLVLYESPHRAGETLADLAAALGPDRPACLARELTKTHEELVRGPLGQLATRYAEERPLGEVTLVVAGAPEPGEGLDLPEGGADLRTRAQRLLAAGYSVRDVADILSAETATPRKPLYDLALSLKGETQ